MSSITRTLFKTWRKIRHMAATVASFSIFGAWGTWLAWVDLPRIYRRTPGDDEAKSLACRERVSASFRFLFRFMNRRRLFELEAIPSRNDLPADGKFILIANHPSLVDMVALFACFPQVVIVAANYMYRTPALGPLLRLCKFIDGGDGSVFSGASVVSAGVHRLSQGTPVLIFPEGTRSPIRGFGSFRCGAFEMAKQAGVPLIPAYISTVPRTLMKGMPWYKIPVEEVKIRITLGNPIHCGEGESARSLMKRVQSHYEEKLNEIGLIASVGTSPELIEKSSAISPSTSVEKSFESSVDGRNFEASSASVAKAESMAVADSADSMASLNQTSSDRSAIDSSASPKSALEFESAPSSSPFGSSDRDS